MAFTGWGCRDIQRRRSINFRVAKWFQKDMSATPTLDTSAEADIAGYKGSYYQNLI